ncbi:MAG: hypothetical protein ABSG43_19210, partial [Solirubrobacteraceae bacterium]
EGGASEPTSVGASQPHAGASKPGAGQPDGASEPGAGQPDGGSEPGAGQPDGASEPGAGQPDGASEPSALVAAAGGPSANGYPGARGEDPGDQSTDREPKHALNNPAVDPDPTELPDPYDKREDPRGPDAVDSELLRQPSHSPTAALSTSEPHRSQDPEAVPSHAPPGDKLDD